MTCSPLPGLWLMLTPNSFMILLTTARKSGGSSMLYFSYALARALGPLPCCLNMSLWIWGSLKLDPPTLRTLMSEGCTWTTRGAAATSEAATAARLAIFMAAEEETGWRGDDKQGSAL